MKIGLSLLCEQPNRKTGLTSLFTCFVREALRCYDDLEVVLFCATGQSLNIVSERLHISGGYAANDQLAKRLATEQLMIGPAAKKLGCDALLTTGLVPVISPLPVCMHLLTLHHLSAENQIGGWRSKYRRWASNHGLERAKLVITNTQFACSQILSVAPEVAPKLLQSYEGIDHEVFHNRVNASEKELLKTRFGITGSYFFWCSNFYPYKQAELMMEAWCDLPKEVRKTYPLVLVGGSAWGNSKEKALEIAQRRGAADDVKFLGWVSDEEVPILFRHAFVFVHPSREETFGRSVLEAMASGVPCVVQGIPVMHEVTAGHALIVDYNDRGAACNAMLTAAHDENTRSLLISGGLARAQEFSFERLAVERIEALRLMLGLSATPLGKKFSPNFASTFS